MDYTRKKFKDNIHNSGMPNMYCRIIALYFEGGGETTIEATVVESTKSTPLDIFFSRRHILQSLVEYIKGHVWNGHDLEDAVSKFLPLIEETIAEVPHHPIGSGGTYPDLTPEICQKWRINDAALQLQKRGVKLFPIIYQHPEVLFGLLNYE